MIASVSCPGSVVPGREFAGRTAVITGASSGIGEAIALELAGRGAALAAASRNRSALQACPDRGFEADLSTDAGLEAWIEDLVSNLPAVDLLIHAAGVIVPARMDAARIEDLDLQYRLNVRAPYRITQALLPAVACQPRTGGFCELERRAPRRLRTSGQYAATKAALAAIADSLRDEVNSGRHPCPYGLPRPHRQPHAEAAPSEPKSRPWQPGRLAQPSDIAHAVVQALLLPRTAEITEIAIRPMLKD